MGGNNIYNSGWVIRCKRVWEGFKYRCNSGWVASIGAILAQLAAVVSWAGGGMRGALGCVRQENTHYPPSPPSHPPALCIAGGQCGEPYSLPESQRAGPGSHRGFGAKAC